MIKIIQLSDECFWGYNEVLDITLFNLFKELGEYNLVILAEKLKLHNHMMNYIIILFIYVVV